MNKNLKKEQLQRHIKLLNKRNQVTMVLLFLLAIVVHFTTIIDSPGFDVTIVIFLMIMFWLININLKQKAIIRYITDSIGDNE